jgi:flagellar basal-body rod protein FlgB
MFNSINSDPTIGAVEQSLGGLSMRKDLISQNIANVDTPGYQAQEVNFEGALQQAMNMGSRLPLTTTSAMHISTVPAMTGDTYQVGLRQGGTERADGNNVDIDQELTQMSETGLRYQGLTSAVNIKLNLLKTIASDR